MGASYKVGDKVKIREDLEEGDEFVFPVNRCMELYAGDEATIIECDEESYAIPVYHLSAPSRIPYSWTEDMFERKIMTAEEILTWLITHKANPADTAFEKVFGKKYTIPELFAHFSPKEVVEKIEIYEENYDDYESSDLIKTFSK